MSPTRALVAALVSTGWIGMTSAGTIVCPGTNPEWSSDGTLLLHTRYQEPGLYVVAVDGGSSELVIPNGSGPAVFWSDDTEIIYTLGEDLWRANVDGSDPRRWGEHSRGPFVTKDGARLAYTYEVYESFEHIETCYRALDPANPYAFGRLFCNAHLGVVGWYPDHEHFLAIDDGRAILYAIEDESAVLLVDGLPTDLRDPDIAPDGERFVYARFVMYDQPRSQLFMWENGVETQLTDHSFVQSYAPRWSPDGRRIAHHTYGNALGGIHYVEVMEVAETPTRRMSWSDLKGRFAERVARETGAE